MAHKGLLLYKEITDLYIAEWSSFEKASIKTANNMSILIALNKMN